MANILFNLIFFTTMFIEISCMFQVERIKDNEHGTVNMEMLENALKV